MAPVGEGNLPWEKILTTLEKCGKTQYLLVEQDVCQESPLCVPGEELSVFE